MDPKLQFLWLVLNKLAFACKITSHYIIKTDSANSGNQIPPYSRVCSFCFDCLCLKGSLRCKLKFLGLFCAFPGTRVVTF